MNYKILALALVLCLVSGIAPNTNPCDDVNPCTNDVYDSQYQRCINQPVPYGTFCSTGKMCDGQGTCITNPSQLESFCGNQRIDSGEECEPVGSYTCEGPIKYLCSSSCKKERVGCHSLCKAQCASDKECQTGSCDLSTCTCITPQSAPCAQGQECINPEDGKIRGCTKVLTPTGSPLSCSSAITSVAYCHTCPASVCGNTLLEGNEQCEACPTCPVGSTSGPACRLYCDQGKSCDLKTCTCISSTTPMCGNGIVEGNEQCELCKECPVGSQCPPCPSPCFEGQCDYRTCMCVGTSTPACGDGQCGVNEGETHYSCPRDCPCQLWVGLAPEMPWTYGSPAKFKITMHGTSESPLSAKVTFYDSTGMARDVFLQQGTTTPVFADLFATIDRPAPSAPIQLFLTFCNQGYYCNGQTCVSQDQPSTTQCPPDCMCLRKEDAIAKWGYEASQRRMCSQTTSPICYLSETTGAQVPGYCFRISDEPTTVQCPPGCSCLSRRDAYAKGLSEPCQACAEVQCDATGACEQPCQTIYCGKDTSGEELKCFKTTPGPGPQCPPGCSCITKAEARMRGFDLCGGIAKVCEPSATGEVKYCFGRPGQQPPVAQCPEGCSCLTKDYARKILGTDSIEQYLCQREPCGYEPVQPPSGIDVLIEPPPKYCFKIPSTIVIEHNMCEQAGGYCINMYGECPTGSSSSDLACDTDSSKCCMKQQGPSCESICKQKCETTCDGTVPDCPVSFDIECFKQCMTSCTPGQPPAVTPDTGELTKALNRVADLLERLIGMLNSLLGQPGKK